MKNSLRLILMITFFFSLRGYGSFDEAQKVQINRTVYKAEQYLKKAVTRDLRMATGVDEILINISIDVSKEKIYEEITTVDKNMKKIEEMQLPSLFINTDQQKKLKEVKNIDLEHVLSHIKKIKMEISSPYDILDEEEFKSKIKYVLSANYNRVGEIELIMEFKKIQQLLVDNRKISLTTPRYIGIFNEAKKIVPYLIAGLGVVFFCLIIFLVLFNRSMGKMTSAIDDIEVKGNLTASFSTPPPKTFEAEVKKNKIRNIDDNSNANIITYFELSEKIKEMMAEDYSVVAQFIDLNFQTNQLELNIIMISLLSKKERTKVYENISKKYLVGFKQYTVERGGEVFEDEALLFHYAKEIFQILNLSIVKSDCLYKIYLSKIINDFPLDKISLVIEQCSNKEILHFIESMDGPTFAYACAVNNFTNIDFSSTDYTFTDEENKEFVTKLANINFVDVGMTIGRDKTAIIPHLSQELEAQYLDATGISKEYGFNRLVVSYFSLVLEYIANLDFEQIVSITPLFTSEIKGKILEGLPELVVERLQSRDLKVNEDTFKLKLNLYNTLKMEYLSSFNESVDKVINQQDNKNNNKLGQQLDSNDDDNAA